LVSTVRKYGHPPYLVALLHGGPGAAGEMEPVAIRLSHSFGVLEFLQTKKSVKGQVEELKKQINSFSKLPLVLIGYSWGAWLGFIFASTYPQKVKKLILISSGAFEKKYNRDLISIRLERLKGVKKVEAENLIHKIDSGCNDKGELQRFGELMTLADSYDYILNKKEKIDIDMDVFNSVWPEARKMRDTNELINHAEEIRCPVVAFHGTYDSHPVAGVKDPLSERLADFKMIVMEKCGHTPWKERFAKKTFFELLLKELNSELSFR
jgi:pimeloyl-ACP methyl ester carboxylesterase